MCESVCQLYRMAGCLEDEEDHGVSEHRITPLRCQPSKGYKPPFSQFPHQFLLSRSPDPFVKNSIDLSILHIYDSPLTTESHEPIPFQAQKRPAFSPLHVVDYRSWLLFIKPIPSCEELGSLNTCARRGYICRYPRPSLGRLSTPEHSPLEKVGRGGGYLGVLSVISLALLLPALSLPTHPSLPEP